jgi:hypothetical protein
MSHLARDTKAMADTARSLANGDEGSLWEHKTRREQKFADVESALPNIKMTPAPDHRPGLTTNLLSYLGRWNPVPHQITSSDTVWLLDNTAYRSANNEWQAEFVAAAFDRSTGVEVSTVVADVAEKLGLGKGDAAEATIQERLIPFVQAVLPARVVKLDFARQRELKLGPGGRNGISSDIRTLPEFENGEIISSMAKVPHGTNGILKMNTVYAEPEGWGLISGRAFFLKLYAFAKYNLQISTTPSKLRRPPIQSASCAQPSSRNRLQSQACPSFINSYKE